MASRRALRAILIAVAGVTAAGLAAIGPATGAPWSGEPADRQNVQDGDSHDQFIVKFRDSSSLSDSRSRRAEAFQDAGDRQRVKVAELRTLAVGGQVVRTSRKLGAADARAFLNRLEARADVEYAEPDARMHAVLTPDDTRYSEQWHYHEATAGLRLPAAWDNATGAGVTVAVIDTGRTAHSDLDANTVAGYDFISDSTAARDGNGRDSNPQDQGDWFSAGECGQNYNANSSWHGTHVAGTIGAVSDNAKGVAGVAFGAKLQHVRVLGKCGGSLSDISDAIVWASGGAVSGVPANSNPAKVINMSLGGSGSCSTTYQNAINDAVGRGSTVVVAAGNSNQNAANFQPASCGNVVTVAALDREGNRSQFRSDGTAGSNYGTVVDVAAPGGETYQTSSNGILSTLNSGTTTPGSESYAFYQGTSMAAPHVAGVAALMLSRKSMTPSEVESTLKQNVRAIPGSCTGGCGAGLVDAAATVNAVIGGPDPSPTPTPTGCAALPETYTGSLSGTGASQYQPNGSYYYSSVSGAHVGCLDGPSGTDFDLYLYKWNGSAWSVVARGESATSHEEITYNGTAGYYRWRIYSYSGSGSYTLKASRP